MSDRARGADSLDARLSRFFLRHRAPFLIILGGVLAGSWYASNWRIVYERSTRILGPQGAAQADVTMGLIATTLYALGTSIGILALRLRK